MNGVLSPMKKGVGKKITFLLTLKFMVYSVRKKDVLKLTPWTQDVN